MAAIGKGLIILSLGALMVLVMLAQPADAGSSFVVYSGPGCSGSSSTLNACGCSNVPAEQKAGYKWTYDGQTSAAYNSDGCTGAAQLQFGDSVNGCAAFGWSSFWIQC